MRPFERQPESHYELATVGRHDDGRSGARASFEQAVALQRAGSLDRFRERMEAESRARRARASLEATKSLCRRAERAALEQARQASRRETAALIAAAERKIEAPLSDQGQLVAALRRGL